MISLTFVNSNTNQQLPVSEIDEQMTVREVVDSLVEHGLIAAPTDGLHYTFAIKRNHRELDRDDATLASGDIMNGDTVMVTRTQRGG